MKLRLALYKSDQQHYHPHSWPDSQSLIIMRAPFYHARQNGKIVWTVQHSATQILPLLAWLPSRRTCSIKGNSDLMMLKESGDSGWQLSPYWCTLVSTVEPNQEDRSVVRVPDLWLKGHRFESPQERQENFLLQGQLSVLTLNSVSVSCPCYRSST